MMSESEQSGMTPPREAGPLDLDLPPSKWPTVLGVIGIVLGSMGLLCSCAGFFSVQLQKWGAEMQAQSGQANPVAEAQVKVAEQFQLATIVLVGLGTILTVVLLAGSIALVRRQRKSRSWLTGWAMASLFVFMLNVALQILIFQGTSRELTQAGEGGRIGELWMGMGIGACFGVVFGLALQIFVLVWFSRKKIIAEVAEWR